MSPLSQESILELPLITVSCWEIISRKALERAKYFKRYELKQENLKITVKINFRSASYNYSMLLATGISWMKKKSRFRLYWLTVFASLLSLSSSQCHPRYTIKKTSKVAFWSKVTKSKFKNRIWIYIFQLWAAVLQNAMVRGVWKSLLTLCFLAGKDFLEVSFPYWKERMGRKICVCLNCVQILTWDYFSFSMCCLVPE